MRTLNRWLRRSILGLMMLVCLGTVAAWCMLPAFAKVNWLDKRTRGAIALNRWRVGQTITLRVDGHGTWLLRNKSRLGVSDECRWSFERAERPEFISCGTGLDSLRLGRDKSRCGFVLQVGAWTNWNGSRTRPYLNAGVPHWFTATASGAWPMWAVVGMWRERRRPKKGFCRWCGYDLRATPSRCPECGESALALVGGA